MKTTSAVTRCALVFGVPVSREEFFERAASRDSDYMRVVLGEEPPEKAWINYYERSAQAAESLSHTASELGAGVFRRATLADFGHASERYEQVILMAHWRGAVVSAADVCDKWQEILKRVRIGNDPVLRLLRVDNFNIDGLVDALNLAITSGSLLSVLPADLGFVGRQSVALGRTLSRDFIDEVFGELIAPGNRVELFDGLHTLAEINDALGKNFAGELDLTLCNSEALAVFLDLSRGNRLQHIHRGDLVDPLPQYLIIAETLRELAVDGGSYIKTRLRIEESL